jgi:pilus assembly protein CpaB
MDVRKLVLLVGALLIAGVTAFMARSMFAGGAVAAANAAPEPPGNEVLVAAKPLPLGTIIAADMLVFQPWPKDMVEKAYFQKGETDPATLVGKVVRHTIMAGQPLAQGALVGPGENGFLAAALSPGMRAITVSVSDTSGVGGFVFPGDRVDLVLTQEVAGAEGQPLRTSETIVRNLRVLAVDQRVDDTSTEAKVGRTATLEVTPKLVEKIAVAQTIGSLSLSLRSIADSAAELERAIAAGEVDVDGNDASADQALELAMARQPSDVNPTYTVGGEVSRFQRSSMPAQKRDRDEAARNEAAGAAAKIIGASAPRGPVVRIARGNAVEMVSVGAR